MSVTTSTIELHLSKVSKVRRLKPRQEGGPQCNAGTVRAHVKINHRCVRVVLWGQVGQPFHGIWGLSGTGRGALHRANLSRLTGTRFVSLKITPVCKPFQCFCDRLDNQFVVFGLGRNGGGGISASYKRGIASCKPVGVDMDPFGKF